MNQKNKLKEDRIVQVKILANMVFNYQGSDKEVQAKQTGADMAALTLDEIISTAVEEREREIFEKLYRGLIREEGIEVEKEWPIQDWEVIKLSDVKEILISIKDRSEGK